MIRIAFTLIGGKSWTGGYNYLLNLLRVVTEKRPGALQPVLFFGTDIDPEDAAPFEEIKGVEIIRCPLMNMDRRNSNLLKSLVLGASPAIRNLFQQHRIDVLFENAQFYGRNIGVPAIAWIPDFQHRELSHLFSRGAWWKRELGFRAQILGSRTIMLSSNDARSSCESYYPNTKGRTHVVRFAVPPSHIPDANEIASVRSTYDLPERYFYLPNQFWQHKNHLLVIDALALLKARGEKILVVASGNQRDPYRPEHFEKIRTRLQSTGVSDQFRMLGLIPYKNIAPLMAGSIALLNPSLFEGWSTTVEEARGLGVPMILSNLPVHREQADGIARFFDRHTAADLAETLHSAWIDSANFCPSAENPQKDQLDPVQRFADDFVTLAEQVSMQHIKRTKRSK
ncbi:glycosyltransferase family 4 protein [Herbaspirillum huttiense]|uniref:glycosyltransferase family 4 protein n=1 Tax=Herbaspirillum huttiense TaxID=863372 RepID=UPI0039AFD755